METGMHILEVYLNEKLESDDLKTYNQRSKTENIKL